MSKQVASKLRASSERRAEKRLRGWQREALQIYRSCLERGATSLLWEATPGAGKTTAALIVCSHQLRTNPGSRLIVVVPTAHLKIQWARSAAEFGINLDTGFTVGRNARAGGEPSRSPLARDFQGAAVTYQQIANHPGFFRSLTKGATVVLDEVHHAGDGLSWGKSLRLGLQDARFVLCLSGTAFRSDRNTIPFVKYDGSGMSTPDYGYPYSRAIVDGVCRPTAFFTYGGEVGWSIDDNEVMADFSDELDRNTAARRLRAALDPESSWLEPMLRDAHEMVMKTRKTHLDAGALLVAADQDHARALAKMIKEISGTSPAIVLSDDARASKKIKEFAAGTAPWLVACNMVSEGVDIPRLRVGVYATTIRTRMYFRQFLGRIVRRTPAPLGVQVAYCYLPADAALRKLAEEIEMETRHCIHAPSDREFGEGDRVRRPDPDAPPPVWQAVHGHNTGVEAVIVSGNQLTLFGGPSARDQFSQDEQLQQAIQQQIQNRIEEAPTRSELKEELARQIKLLVGQYHRRSGKAHSFIHTLLNRQQRVKSQAECTVPQLEERIKLLEGYLVTAA